MDENQNPLGGEMEDSPPQAPQQQPAEDTDASDEFGLDVNSSSEIPEEGGESIGEAAGLPDTPESQTDTSGDTDSEAAANELAQGVQEEKAKNPTSNSDASEEFDAPSPEEIQGDAPEAEDSVEEDVLPKEEDREKKEEDLLPPEEEKSLNDSMTEDLGDVTEDQIKDAEDGKKKIIITPELETAITNGIGGKNIPDNPQGALPTVEESLKQPKEDVDNLQSQLKNHNAVDEIHSEIADNAGISSEDAQNIQARIESFKLAIHPGSFTKLKSRINYTKTLMFLEAYKKKRQEEFCDTLNCFMTDTLDEAHGTAMEYKSDKGLMVVKDINLLRERIMIFKHRPRYDQHYLVDKNGIPHEILNHDLKDFNFKLRLEPEFYTQTFKAFAKCIYDLIKLDKRNPLLRTLVYGIKEGFTEDEIIASHQRGDYGVVSISILDFLMTFEDGRIAKSLELFIQGFEQSYKRIKEVEKESGIRDFKEARDFVMKHGEEMDKVSNYAFYMADIIDLLEDMIKASNIILNYLDD